MQNGVNSPVCQNKEAADQKFGFFFNDIGNNSLFSYDRIVSMLIQEASKSKLECVLAGHNENSIIAAVDQLASQTGE